MLFRSNIDVPAADRRENRLKLLNEIREAARAVSDFAIRPSRVDQQMAGESVGAS